MPPEAADVGLGRVGGLVGLTDAPREGDLQTLLVEVAYEGTGFSGWAPQPGRRTVAGVLLEAVRAMRSEVAEVRGASRTDAGVHARGQVAAFDAKAGIPPRGWALGLNAKLPDDVSIARVAVAAPGFVPRFSSRGKRYVYTILEHPIRDALLGRRALHVHDALDVDRMQREARDALGRHDFAAFRSAADQRTDTVREIARLDVARAVDDARLVRVTVEGDGFLHNMVRILAGTLVEIGTGRLAPGAIGRALLSKRREDLGKTAPAHGLLLDEVFVDWPDGAWPS